MTGRSRGEWNVSWGKLEGKPPIVATTIGNPGEKTPRRGTRWSYSKGIARVAALNAKTGAAMKVGRLEGVLENYYASPVAASGRVYFTSETGKVVVVKAGADWSVLAYNDLDEPCYATLRLTPPLDIENNSSSSRRGLVVAQRLPNEG